MSNSAAPDVDLKAQGGLSSQVTFGVTVLALAFFANSYFQGKSSGGTDVDEDEDSPLWLLWLVLFVIKCIVQLAFGLAFMVLAALIIRQRSIIYVPVPPGMKRSTKENPNGHANPKERGLPCEDVYIETEDGVKVNAWFIYQPISKCQDEDPYTFVYFHGNAGNIGHRMDNLKDMHKILGINILILDYRGYGDSEDGSGPSEDGFIKDAMATYRWLVNRIRNPPETPVTRMSAEKIMLFGRSIGGAVAFRLAGLLLQKRMLALSDSKTCGNDDSDILPLPAGLVLENTFTSLRDMAVTVFPFLTILKPVLRFPVIFDEWRASDSLEFMVSNHDNWCCCLLSGLRDQIVPPLQMEQLANILREKRPKVFKFFKFKNGGHNDTPVVGGLEYWESFKKFMADVRSTEEARREGLLKSGLGPAA